MTTQATRAALAAFVTNCDRRAATRIATVEHLTAHGHDFATIAERLQLQPGHLARWLRRRGRNDLARPRTGVAAMLAAKTDQWEATLEDIRWLADTGETLPAIARRIGVQPDSLTRRLRRRGETDLLERIRPKENR